MNRIGYVHARSRRGREAWILTDSLVDMFVVARAMEASGFAMHLIEASSCNMTAMTQGMNINRSKRPVENKSLSYCLGPTAHPTNSTTWRFKFDTASNAGCNTVCIDAYIPDTTTYVFVSSPLEETAAVPNPEPAILVPVPVVLFVLALALVALVLLVLGLRCDASNTAGNDTAMLLASWRCDISIVLTVFVRTDHQYDVKRAICKTPLP